MGTAFKFVNNEWVEVETTSDKAGKIYINGEFIQAFLTTYLPVKGHTAVLLSWEDFDEDNGMYTPWNTWYGNDTKDKAWNDALSWAMAEDIPAIKS